MKCIFIRCNENH